MSIVCATLTCVYLFIARSKKPWLIQSDVNVKYSLNNLPGKLAREGRVPYFLGGPFPCTLPRNVCGLPNTFCPPRLPAYYNVFLTKIPHVTPSDTDKGTLEMCHKSETLYNLKIMSLNLATSQTNIHNAPQLHKHFRVWKCKTREAFTSQPIRGEDFPKLFTTPLKFPQTRRMFKKRNWCRIVRTQKGGWEKSTYRTTHLLLLYLPLSERRFHVHH